MSFRCSVSRALPLSVESQKRDAQIFNIINLKYFMTQMKPNFQWSKVTKELIILKPYLLTFVICILTSSKLKLVNYNHLLDFVENVDFQSSSSMMHTYNASQKHKSTLLHSPIRMY